MYKHVFCGGHFRAGNGKVYEIEVETPYEYKSAEAAEKDKTAFRFRKICSVVFLEAYPGEIIVTGRNKDGKIYIKKTVVGDPVRTYAYEDFIKSPLNRLMKRVDADEIAEAVSEGYSTAKLTTEEFEPAAETFNELFPELGEDEFVYIEGESYYIEEVSGEASDHF